MEEYLNDEEIVLVKQFIQNNKMSEAVKKVLLYGIYGNGTLEAGKRATPLKNWALGLFMGHQDGNISNEVLGQDLRASAMGIHFLETAFDKMIGMALEKVKPEVKKNPAV